jgi:hemoglobin
MSDETLYSRLGGYDAIAGMVDDFFGRLMEDKLNSRFLLTLADDRKMRARQLTIDFICAAAGGPSLYIGRDMLAVHKGMGITAADWDASVDHFVATLDKFEVAEAEKSEALAFYQGQKADIVEA